MPPGGLEPPTKGLGNLCSIHLSYGGTRPKYNRREGGGSAASGPSTFVFWIIAFRFWTGSPPIDATCGQNGALDGGIACVKRLFA